MKENKFSWTGIAFGSVALLLATISYMAGPFSPQATLEHAVAAKVVAIKHAALSALQGKEAAAAVSAWTIDRILTVITALLAGGAFIFAAVGLARKENHRMAFIAALLGVGAATLHFTLPVLGLFLLLFLLSILLQGTLC